MHNCLWLTPRIALNLNVAVQYTVQCFEALIRWFFRHQYQYRRTPQSFVDTHFSAFRQRKVNHEFTQQISTGKTWLELRLVRFTQLIGNTCKLPLSKCYKRRLHLAKNCCGNAASVSAGTDWFSYFSCIELYFEFFHIWAFTFLSSYMQSCSFRDVSV